MADCAGIFFVVSLIPFRFSSPEFIEELADFETCQSSVRKKDEIAM